MLNCYVTNASQWAISKPCKANRVSHEVIKGIQGFTAGIAWGLLYFVTVTIAMLWE